MKPYLAVFVSVFLAELGDKTQLATLLFAANPAVRASSGIPRRRRRPRGVDGGGGGRRRSDRDRRTSPGLEDHRRNRLPSRRALDADRPILTRLDANAAIEPPIAHSADCLNRPEFSGGSIL
jgi:Uncharacterized protein family UPF0016